MGRRGRRRMYPRVEVETSHLLSYSVRPGSLSTRQDHTKEISCCLFQIQYRPQFKAPKRKKKTHQGWRASYFFGGALRYFQQRRRFIFFTVSVETNKNSKRRRDLSLSDCPPISYKRSHPTSSEIPDLSRIFLVVTESEEWQRTNGPAREFSLCQHGEDNILY
jgi:hypothetical protein